MPRLGSGIRQGRPQPAYERQRRAQAMFSPVLGSASPNRIRLLTCLFLTHPFVTTIFLSIVVVVRTHWPLHPQWCLQETSRTGIFHSSALSGTCSLSCPMASIARVARDDDALTCLSGAGQLSWSRSPRPPGNSGQGATASVALSATPAMQNL